MATFEIQKQNSITEISISGDLDIYSVAELYKDHISKLDYSNTLVIDLSNLSAIDTAGAQLLLYTTNKAQQQGQGAEILSVSDVAQNFFDAFNLSPHLPFSGLILA